MLFLTHVFPDAKCSCSLQRDLNLAKIALDTNGPLQDFALERATWIPKAATTQRLDVNEVLEQFSIEKKSISFADRMYFTSTEDIQNFGDIICESRPACEREKHLMHMRVFDVGNRKLFCIRGAHCEKIV